MPRKKINYGADVELEIEMDTKMLDTVYKQVVSASKKHLRYGCLDKKKYPASHKNKGMYIAQIAEWQEYGTFNVPARPYAMVNFLQQTSLIMPLVSNYFKSACYGQTDITILNKIAESGRKGYKDLVMAQGFERLSDTTIRLKGHDFQMDHSGYLLNNYNVKVYATSFDKIDSRAT